MVSVLWVLPLPCGYKMCGNLKGGRLPPGGEGHLGHVFRGQVRTPWCVGKRLSRVEAFFCWGDVAVVERA